MLQIPSKMKGSNSRMLQIPLKRQLQLQNVTNVLGKMKGSNSKMLQLARKRAEKSIPKKNKTENNIIPQAILDPEIKLAATCSHGISVQVPPLDNIFSIGWAQDLARCTHLNLRNVISYNLAPLGFHPRVVAGPQTHKKT